MPLTFMLPAVVLNPQSLALIRSFSLFLCPLLGLHIQRAKLNMNIAHICDIYYIFFVFWEAYAQLTKYFNLAAFCSVVQRTCFV